MAVTFEELAKRLTELEHEVDSLRAQIKPMRKLAGTIEMADLYGAWTGQLNASEEDFAAVEFSTRWLSADNQG
jgi:hypothetical protein